METSPKYCSSCFHTIQDTDFYCPFCGRALKEKPLSTTLAKQLSIYAISFLLPPLGLWPAMKYLQNSNPATKRIGITAVILTIVSIIVSVYVLKGLVNSVNDQITKQLNQGLLGY